MEVFFSPPVVELVRLFALICLVNHRDLVSAPLRFII